MTRCKLIPDSGGISVTTPYDAGWVAEFKSAIPTTERKPIKHGEKFIGWIVSAKYGKAVQDLCMKYFNELPLLPDIANVKPMTKQQIIEVRYIGLTKERGGSDDRSAFGWYKDGWNVMFPEAILRAWFDAPQNPDEAPTLYSVLAVNRGASDDEIKTGYRRMVMQWHPDRCREPNAQEQFLAIQHAYEILSKNRERYDAGLVFEMSLRNNQSNKSSGNVIFDAVIGYRSPLRCGLIMCEGTEVLGIFQVSKIYAWEDVRDSSGRILVVSWPKGADKFEEIWC